MSKLVSKSKSVLQQEKALLNPFEISDDEILQKVYITHFHCVETYDVGSLHSVASNIIKHSIEISDVIIENGPQVEQFREDKSPLISFTRFPALKRIACQMICTPFGEHHAHQTTMLILEQLKAYSWDAKAAIAMAAFALEYGKFWLLVQSPRDQLGKSLAELNGLQNIEENMQQLVKFSNLVKKIMQVIDCISEWKKLTTAEYEIKDVHALSDSLQVIPVIVYWAIITFVACTSNIDYLGDRSYKFELSKFDYKLDLILKNFKDHLDRCNQQIGTIEDYSRRKAIVIGHQSGKDIVTVLKALIISGDTQDSKTSMYNGLTAEKVGVEIFKKKYVLLFISGLDNIEEEIHLLKSVYEGLKEEPKEVEGYRKEDFTLLWVPIVDDWNDMQKRKLEKILEQTQIGCYVVKEFNFSTGIKLIREVFNYKDNPIIPLISPEGKVENSDAKQIIFDWRIDGFPFRTSDYIRLTQQWNWFWAEMINISPKIRELIKKDNFIFIYGGTNKKWLQDFTAALEKLKRHETILQEDIIIESYPLEKEGPKIVPRFWIGIDSLLASKKQGKGGVEAPEYATRELKKLLFLKQDPHGWVILSKGSHVKVLGQGEAMYRTVMDFETWKVKLQKEVVKSFDVAFKEYYESKVKDFPQKCAYSEYANYPTDILAHLPCPHKCGREMEVASVNYKCCHGRETSEVPYKYNVTLP